MKMKIKLAALVYEDGSVLYFPGKEGQEWVDKCNAAVMSADIHNMNPFRHAPVKEERITLDEFKKHVSEL
jgi:hypothetical protein